VLQLEIKAIIGIDLAAKPENPTGWASWLDRIVEASLAFTDNEIIERIIRSEPLLIAIDAPFRHPKEGIARRADHEMVRRGYRVFPPGLPAMKQLTARAIKTIKLIVEKGYKAIEVHPTSTRKALNMPLKDWGKIQAMLKKMGLEGDLQTRILTPHEVDAVTSALTAYLHLHNQTEAIGDKEEGYIIIPKRQDWRTIHI